MSLSVKRTGTVLAGLLLLSQVAQAVPRQSLSDGANDLQRSVWIKLQSDLALERDLIERCRSSLESCPTAAARQFVAIVEEGLQYKNRARIAHINRAVNLAIRPQIEPVLTWNAPLTTLAAGKGDCKQYAVVKYAALREAGFAANQLRIVVVKDNTRHGTHAVVAVRHGTQWLVLDSRNSILVEFNKFTERYAFLWTLDYGVSGDFAPPAKRREAGFQ